jgi:hypothetical protein
MNEAGIANRANMGRYFKIDEILMDSIDLSLRK